MVSIILQDDVRSCVEAAGEGQNAVGDDGNADFEELMARKIAREAARIAEECVREIC
jgi:hypothetical protein